MTEIEKRPTCHPDHFGTVDRWHQCWSTHVAPSVTLQDILHPEFLRHVPERYTLTPGDLIDVYHQDWDATLRVKVVGDGITIVRLVHSTADTEDGDQPSPTRKISIRFTPGKGWRAHGNSGAFYSTKEEASAAASVAAA